MIKIIIADDEKLIRTGLKMMLETYEDIEVVGLASDGREAYELTKTYKPDLVLMDIRMPGMSGIEGTRLIKKEFPDIFVLVVTTFKDTDYIVQAMDYGASGYLLKDSSDSEIYKGIHLAISGKVVLDSEVSKNLIDHKISGSNKNNDFDKSILTDREQDYISLVCKGLSNKEIAENLFLSEGTVKNNISNILLKLDLRDRTQLAIFGIKNGFDI